MPAARLGFIGACLMSMCLAAIAAPAIDSHDSTHAFQKTTTGGIQQIVANDPKDKALVAAIRDYLLAEAQRFGTGDYGKGTPGVEHLSAIKPGQIHVIYRSLPAGAAVDYQGRDAAAVDAIHQWLDAEIDAQDAADNP